MEIMIVLIGASLLLAVLFLILFIIAGRQGQFRDTYTPSIRILFEDENSDNNNLHN